jgi:hypothetical protein
MLGGNLNPKPTINRMDKMCLPHPIRGISLFRETHSSRGDTILKLHNNLFLLKGLIYILLMEQMPNMAYNPQNPSGYPPLTHVSRTPSNPVYPGQHQPYTRGPNGYNYPPNPVYGPTGVPMTHQYYLQVNQQLPFLVTLDLPDLSRLTNDPIFHSPVWPAIPAKLPADIPKFDGKSMEKTQTTM